MICVKSSSNGRISFATDPFNEWIALFALISSFAQIKSLIPSAWDKSIFPLRNARSVNSPRRAIRAPAPRMRDNTFLVI